jgi:hypothetical protein
MANPVAGLTSTVATGGTPVLVTNPNALGGYIMNPASNTDQGIATAEPLYVNLVAAATLEGNGTTIALQPGATWPLIAGQTTPASVNAATSGHQFTVVVWYS